MAARTRRRLSRKATLVFAASLLTPLSTVSGTSSELADPLDPLPMCGPYDQVRNLLAERFDERPTSSGLADDGTVMQVFASAGAESWTALSVGRDGIACVVATGRAWQQEALSRQGEPV